MINKKTDEKNKFKYGAVVIGASAGGYGAISKILQELPKDFPIPILIIQHVSPNSNNYAVGHMAKISKIEVKECEEKELLVPGTAYFAPPNYHMLIEMDETISLTVSEKVNYSRPSIDVLFETAADAFGERLIGVILTGANSDGSKGLKRVKEKGGITLVQDPETAEVDAMPRAAIDLLKPDFIIELDKISMKLITLVGEKYED